MHTNITLFSQLNLNAPILTALEKIGYEQPTPIQAQTIPHLLDGVDLLGKAQTGTGKTAAFGLPLLNKLDLSQHKPQAIVLAPTRELALQVAREIKELGQNIKGLKVAEIYGGASIGDQMHLLRSGVHIVVGTPGRVKDLLNRKRLHLDEAKTFVLDEADEMLKMGFIDDVTWILEQASPAAQRVLFSATMPPMVKHIVERFLRKPILIDVAGKNQTLEKVEQQYWVAKGVDKDEALARLLETETSDGNMVFVRTRQDTERLADWLKVRGFRAAALHGDIPQSLRERTVDQLKRGSIDVLVATDVVARGLDVPRITHVYNYDIPFDVESYIHRIGRTGRAGRKGKAILLVRTNQMRLLRTIEKVSNSKMEEIQLPDRDKVAAARVEQLVHSLRDELGSPILETFTNIISKIQAELEVDELTLAALLLKRQQGKRPLFYKGPDPMIAAIERENNRRNDRRSNRGSEGGKGAYRDRDSWDTYQFEIGREQGLQVKDIVGAIVNELGYAKSNIGAIKLQSSHSYVQLPKKLTDAKLQELQKLRIRKNETKAHRVDDNVLDEHGGGRGGDNRGRGGDNRGRGGDNRGRGGDNRGRGGDNRGRGGDNRGRGGDNRGRGGDNRGRGGDNRGGDNRGRGGDNRGRGGDNRNFKGKR